MSPDWRRKGGQVQLPKTSTTGFFPWKLESFTSFLPNGSGRVKSGAASPTLSLSGWRSPGAGGVNFSPGSGFGVWPERAPTSVALRKQAAKKRGLGWFMRLPREGKKQDRRREKFLTARHIAYSMLHVSQPAFLPPVTKNLANRRTCPAFP